MSNTCRGPLMAIGLLPAVVPIVAQPVPEPAATTSAPAAERPTKAVPRSGCVTAACHPGIKRFKVLHGPLNVDACDACHEVVSDAEHTFKPARDKAHLCRFCHYMDTNEAPVVHEPLKTGECTGCHDPHGGESRTLLKGTSVNDLCRSCHDDVIGGAAVVHGPVAAGACSACHLPHTSPYPNLLGQEGSGLCLQCHASMETRLETSRVVHEPAAGDCQECHDPHASDHEEMLKADPTTLCESCHEQIQHTVATAKTQHAAVTTERGCVNCHTAHASDFPSLLKEDMTQLCLECHDKKIKLPDGTTLANMETVLAQGASLHGPVAKSNCAACHQLHGGSNFRLLVQEYPPEFYAPFREETYALCFKCHDAQLVRAEKTTSLTDFRNGDTNLHYLHVNRKTKGRTCRACHETHASRNAKHIRDAVPFGRGGWMLPIRYEPREHGGKCSPGCHRPYVYDRIHPVHYEPPAEPARWPTTSVAPATSRPGPGVKP